MMKKGFSLIELMVVILLLGIIAAMGIPRFLRSPQVPSQDFIGRLNTITGEGVYAAQLTNKVHRIFFDLLGGKVEVQTAAGALVHKGIAIPKNVRIEDVLINGKSQFTAGVGDKRSVYFLINPEGISQEVELIIIDEKVRANNPRGGEYTFYLNPFTSVFRLK